MKNVSRPQNTKKTLGMLAKYLGKHPFLLSLIVLLVIHSGFVNVYGIYLIRELIDSFNGEVFIQVVNTQIRDLALLLFSGAAAAFIYNPLMVYLSQKIIQEIRQELFVHSQDLPLVYFDTHKRGEIMSYFTNDIDTLNEALNTGFTTLVYSIVTGVGTIVFLFLINFYLSLIVIFFILLMFFFIYLNKKKSRSYFAAMQKSVAKLNSFVEEMSVGHKVSIMFEHEAKDLATFDFLNKEVQLAGVKAQENALRVTPIVVALSYFNYAVSAVAGALFVLNGWLSVGSLGSYLIYVRQSSNPFNNFTNQLNALYNGLAGAERIFAFLAIPKEIDEGDITLVSVAKKDEQLFETSRPTNLLAWKIPKEEGFDYVLFEGKVVFENVSFGYKEGDLVLKDVSLHARNGEKIALVGSTGAGKTTIINLITRFYEINSGTIYYDGIDIRRIKKDDLRRSVSVVIQDTHLFTGTIYENIAYSSPQASLVEVVHASKIANAHYFIEHLPEGYNTKLIDNGHNLSSGQRQLIAIARAAIVQPPVLILDEATSSIDSRSEKLIEKAMDQLMENKTVFVIAHRLSTIRNANAILVLEKGSIIERGSHDALIAEGKVYYALYTGQFEWT